MRILKNDPNLNTLQKDQTIMLFLERPHKVYEQTNLCCSALDWMCSEASSSELVRKPCDYKKISKPAPELYA